MKNRSRHIFHHLLGFSVVLLRVNVCALLSCARSQDQQTTAGLAEYMAAVEYLAAIETNKPVQQTTAGLVEYDVPVLVRMLIHSAEDCRGSTGAAH